MTIDRRHFTMGLAGSAALLATPALAQSFPTKPINLVVPFAPGGSTDVVARIIAAKMSETMGQQVIVENRAGAGGGVGAAAVADTGGQHFALTGAAETVAEMCRIVELDDNAAGRAAVGGDFGQRFIKTGDHLIGHRAGRGLRHLAAEGQHGNRQRKGQGCKGRFTRDPESANRQKRQKRKDLPGMGRQPLQRESHAKSPCYRRQCACFPEVTLGGCS